MDPGAQATAHTEAYSDSYTDPSTDPYTDPYAQAYGAHDPYANDPYASGPPDAHAESTPWTSGYGQPGYGYTDSYRTTDPYGWSSIPPSHPPTGPPAAPKSGSGGRWAVLGVAVAASALVAGTVGGAVGFTAARLTAPESTATVIDRRRFGRYRTAAEPRGQWVDRCGGRRATAIRRAVERLWQRRSRHRLRIHDPRGRLHPHQQPRHGRWFIDRDLIRRWDDGAWRAWLVRIPATTLRS